MDDASTAPSFPTYAELTETQGWATTARPIAPPRHARLRSETGSDRYTEGVVLGVGGMGKVLLARDERVGREVAVKVLKTDDLTEEEKQRFLREAQVQGQLEHPAIVPVYDIDQRPDGSTFFTMRRVVGKTLHAIFDELRLGSPEAKAKYTRRELLQAFGTVCLAIDYAHTRGVIHRDLKPANVMLGDYGEVYVLDWGIARISEGEASTTSRLSRPGSMLGTPLYMAPEQMADPDVGPAADVWSLGAILFEMLTGERLRDHRALYAPVEARPSVRAPDLEIDRELELICVKATELNANERYPTARALQEAIAAYLDFDRQVEQRRSEASTRAERARAALAAADREGSDYEKERGVAISELVQALALEPRKSEYVALLGEILEKPPRVVPPEVRAKLTRMDQEVVKLGTSFTRYATLAWLGFLPIVYLSGFRRYDYLAVIVVAIVATSAIAWYASLRPVVSRPLQYVMPLGLMIASMALSRIFGPLILMPTMVIAWGISTQVHPDAVWRWYALGLCALGIVLPVIAEAIGVLPESYVFGEHGWLVLPQMIDMPHGLTVAWLTAATVLIGVFPALLVSRLRQDLSNIVQQQQLRAWHFRRLAADLTAASEQ